MKRVLMVVVGCALLWGCVKNDWLLDENIRVEGLDPSFALPLVYTSLNLGDVEQNLDSDDFIFNEQDQTFALIFGSELFRFGANEFQQLPETSFEIEYELDAGEAAALSTAPAGSTLSYSSSETLAFPTTQGEQLDSVIFAGGELQLTLSSDIPGDQEVSIQVPSLSLNGSTFTETISIDYTGVTPFSDNVSFDITGYTLDLSDGGTSNNELDLGIEFTVTSSGQPVVPSSSTSFDAQFDFSQYQSIWGYFGQFDLDISQDTQLVKLYENLDGGVLHFADPSIEFTIGNSTGVPVEIMFSSVFAPENSQEQEITGDDLTNIP
ncbi:MAG: hypothetical protein HKN32_01205, partial [Flavobacteriales bacterium]|nr:hypothetical protein [Flavobacteriales bacterium]